MTPSEPIPFSENNHFQDDLLRRTLEIGRMGYWTYDIASRAFSPIETALYHILGPLPNPVGESRSFFEVLEDLLHPEDRDRAQHYFFDSPETEKRDVFRLLTSREKYAYVEANSKPQFDSQGRVIGRVGVFHDISEQKVSEEIIRERETTVVSVLAAGQAGIWEFDPFNEMIDISDEIAALLKSPPIGSIKVRDYIRQWVHPADQLDIWENFLAVLAGAEGFELECRMIGTDGRILHTRQNGLLAKSDQTGLVRKIVGIVMDITRRVERENELRESHQRYQALFERSNDAIVLLEKDRIIEANHRMLELFDASELASVLGRSPWELAPERQENGETSEERIRKIMRLSSDSSFARQHQWQAKKLSGPVFDTMVSFSRISQTGQMLHLMVLHDVTMQKRAANMFENHRAYLSVLAELRKLFYARCEDDIVRTFMVSMANHFGFSKVWYGQLEGNRVIPLHGAGVHRNIVDVEAFSLDPAIHAPEFPLATALRRNQTIVMKDLDRNPGFAAWRDFVAETHVRSLFIIPLEINNVQEGGIVLYSLRSEVFDSAMIDYVQNIVRELSRILSEKRFWERQQEALRIAKEKAERAGQAKSRFLANISHEIRTPLTAILGFTEMLAGSSVTRATRIETVQVIRNNAEYLLQILNDVLDLSKIDEDKMTIEIRQVPIVPILDEVTTLYANRAREKNLYFKLSNRTPFPDRIHTDSLRLKQILLNLISNAFKFTSRGGVEIVVSWEGVVGGTSGSLQIDIRDTGIGIARDTLPTLFTPFQQADDSTTRRFGGTGLGLAISRRLVQMIGGEISVESELGLGTVFSVRLTQQLPSTVHWIDRLDEVQEEARNATLEAARTDPETGKETERETERKTGQTESAEPTASSSSSPAEVSASQKTPLIGRHILLAEDSPDSQRLFKQILSKAGACVTTADNGQEAFKKTMESWSKGVPFDLVIMDMQMPVMDGYMAVRKLRENNYPLPVVALTAHGMPDEMNRCITAGCDDYANKPISKVALIDIVQKNLRANDAAPLSDGDESNVRPMAW